jgi:protein TonB
MSLMHLHRLRSAGRQAAPCALRDELQRALGTKAEIRYVSGLGQPVTFGVRWPVVLLPDDTLTQPAEIQHAVLCHELIHVDRRDWAWVLAEEIVRAALWFHPAVWWTVSRIQAAREEVVDQQAVRITGARRRYIEALMAFADAAPVAPAAAFSRRQHLFRRILLLSKDRDVSPARLTASCFAMLLVLLAGSWRAIDAFPLLEAASGIAPAITSPEPASNHAATTASIEPRGAVSGVIGGPTPSLPSVAPPPAPVPAPTRPQRSPSASNPGTTAQPRAEGEESVGPPVESGRVEEHDLLVLPESRDTSSHAPAGGVIGGIVGGVVGGVVPPPPPPPPPPPQASALRVGGRIQAPRKIKDVKPAYPPIAEAARVQGIVILEATIGADGRVTDARVIRSIPLLDAAALDAVRQWEFTPTLLNGDPTPIVMTVTVNFTLN